MTLTKVKSISQFLNRGHDLEVELFPREHPPRYTIKHIINGNVKEIREGLQLLLSN